jgi:UDP-N-acetylglucosamine 4,6-dehydratase
MAPNLPIKIVGIRPGEKIHEMMCPREYAHLTLEFSDHYVLQPGIIFFSNPSNYLVNALGEKAKRVPDNFEYNSESNPEFLTIEEISAYNKKAGF